MSAKQRRRISWCRGTQHTCNRTLSLFPIRVSPRASFPLSLRFASLSLTLMHTSYNHFQPNTTANQVTKSSKAAFSTKHLIDLRACLLCC